MTFVTSLAPENALADDKQEESFLPTWKLLKPSERAQFISGYLFGLKSATTVTDIAIEYTKENPQKALEGLAKVRTLYDMQDLKPDSIVRELDTFFADSANKDATLFQAVTNVRSRLGR